MGCNFLSLPLIPASGTQVLHWTTTIKRYPCSTLSKLLCPLYRTDFNTAVLDTATADVCRLLSSPPYSGLKQDPCTFRATFSVIITWENMKLNSGGTAVSRARGLINNDSANGNDNDNENVFITINLHIYKIQHARYKYTERDHQTLFFLW